MEYLLKICWRKRRRLNKKKTNESALMKTVSGILSLPGDIPKKMLNALPQKTKDELAVFLIKNNKVKIAQLLQNTLTEKGIEPGIDGIEISE